MPPNNRNEDVNRIILSRPEELLGKIVERDDVDYKTKFQKSVDHLANTIKIFPAMANSGGGVIVYGVENSNLIGIDEDQQQLLDPARVGDFLDRYLSYVPHISLEVIEYSSMKFGFLYINASMDAPVLISRTVNDSSTKTVLRAGAFYVRHNTKSIEPTDHLQVHRVLDRIINYQVRRKISEILPVLQLPEKKRLETEPQVQVIGRRQAEEEIGLTPSTPMREFILEPSNPQVLSDKALKDAMSIFIDQGSASLPSVSDGDLKGGRSEKGLITYTCKGVTPRLHFDRIEKDGSYYSACSLLEDDFAESGHQGATRFKGGIGVELSLRYIYSAILLARELAAKYSDPGGIRVTHRLKSVKKRKLVLEDSFNRVFHSDKICLDETVLVVLDVGPVTREELISLAVPAVTELYQSFNFQADHLQITKDLETAARNSQIRTRILPF